MDGTGSAGREGLKQMSQAGVPTAQGPGPSPAADRRSRAGWAVAAVLALLVSLGFWYYWNSRVTVIGQQESVNVLALGLGADGLDAVTVVSFNPVTQAVAAVVLPVDTRVSAGQEPQRLTDVYAAEGAAGLARAVEGALAAPVHYTVQVGFDGFEALVDLLGGVTVQVETDIVYRNADGEPVFHLQPGTHRLTGEQALLFIRYKGDHLEDESRRVERQWRFLTALARQARASLDWQRVQGLLQLAVRYVQTDMDLAEVTRLAQFAWQVEKEMALHLAPGQTEDGQWVLDADRLRALSETLFYNPSWVAARR